jgi:hypothetical protein
VRVAVSIPTPLAVGLPVAGARQSDGVLDPVAQEVDIARRLRRQAVPGHRTRAA